MDPFKRLDRLDFFIEPVLNKNPLKRFVEDLFQEQVPLDFKLPLKEMDHFSRIVSEDLMNVRFPGKPIFDHDYLGI